MSKNLKKKVGQYDHYKKWTTGEGYSFMAENLADAIKYIEKMGSHIGTLKEVISED